MESLNLTQEEGKYFVEKKTEKTFRNHFILEAWIV